MGITNICLSFLVIDHFLVIMAGEHYLILCKKLALRTIMVKMEENTKLKLIILEFFNIFFQLTTGQYLELDIMT